MLTNGTYAARFKTGKGEGAGIIVLSDGKIRGGDAAILYLGTYSQDGNDLKANVQTRRHTPGLPSVFGLDEVSITLSGKSTGLKAVCTGVSPQAPGVNLTAELEYLSD